MCCPVSAAPSMLKKFLPTGWWTVNPSGDNDVTTTTCGTEEDGDSGSSEKEKPALPPPSRPISIRKRKSKRYKSFKILKADTNEASNVIPAEMPEVEIVELGEDEKEILRATWKVVYDEIGCSLCYVGSGGGGTADVSESTSQERGVEETFIRLFQEYPSSQEFFVQFRGSPVEDIRNNVKMTKVLQEHAVRVFQLVEKVIGRLDSLQKASLLYVTFLVRLR